MSNQTDQAAFFAYSGGKSLSPAEQDAFHAGWQARADLAAEQIERLEAERKEAARLLRMTGPLVEHFTDSSEPIGSIQKWLAKFNAQEKDDE